MGQQLRERYVRELDPTDLWGIWDTKTDQPVAVSGIPIVGEPERQAAEFCRRLNTRERPNDSGHASWHGRNNFATRTLEPISFGGPTMHDTIENVKSAGREAASAARCGSNSLASR
jgi:hypothetical protein